MASLYQFLYEDIPLRATGIFLGVVLIAVHVFCFFKADLVSAWLKQFPRNKTIGVILLAIAAAWSFMVISHMHLGEFYTILPLVQIAIPVGFIFIIFFADEFLAVRALGVLLLLAACPLLEAAFLKEPVTRLLLPVLAYAWIVVGLFWVGIPYLMRDGIDWITRKPARWKIACSAGAAYGLALLLAAFTWSA